jgi:hypothetical protein
MTFVHDASSSTSMARRDALLARLQLYEGRCIRGRRDDGPRNLLEAFLEVIKREKARRGRARRFRARQQPPPSHGDLYRDGIAGLRIVDSEGEEIELARPSTRCAMRRLSCRNCGRWRSLTKIRPAPGHVRVCVGQPREGTLSPMGHVTLGRGRLLLEAPSRAGLQPAAPAGIACWQALKHSATATPARNQANGRGRVAVD